MKTQSKKQKAKQKAAQQKLELAEQERSNNKTPRKATN
jgi:hypothetical protein